MAKKNSVHKMKNGKYCVYSNNGYGKEYENMDSLKNSEGSEDIYTIDKDYSIAVHHDDEHMNAMGFPQIYYCRHMEPGLCGYEKEKILVDADAMKNMNPSFAGKPVYVGHQKVDLEKLQQEADGYVVESFYNELDGWSWAKIIVVSDKGKAAIANGWAVSNAYVPTEFASGGQSHAIDFERKIVNACYTHLAIVPDPRYEGAKIFTPDEYRAYCSNKKAQLEEMKNSKGVTRMFKNLWNTKREAVTSVDGLNDETVVEMENGQMVSIKEMATVYLNSKVKKNAEGAKEEKKGDEETLNSDTEVSVGGEKMPLSQLMNKYQNAQKMNAAEEEKKKKEDEEKANAVKKNEAEEAKKKKDAEAEAEEKKNAKTFEEMKNARGNGGASGFVFVDTQFDQLARGKANYGSAQ